MTEAVKQCPECRAEVPAEKSLCRECGYVFTGAADQTGLTEQLAKRAVAGNEAMFRKKLRAGVVAGGMLLAAGLYFMIHPPLPPLTWDRARAKLPAPRWYDAQAADGIVEVFRKHGDAVEVRVADGQCLVNYPNRMAGLLSRTVVKLQAMEAALDYCMERDQHGDTATVTVVVFCDGEKFLSAHIKNWKPE